MSDDHEDALRLAERVVRVQGKRFIRELLREKKKAGRPVLIGTRKDEVLNNLRDAIENGWITLNDLQGWLSQVEGWGRQHVYLFRTAKAVADVPQFASLKAFSAHLAEAGLLPEADDDLIFPNTLSLEAPKHYDGIFELSWKRGRYEWSRDSGMDEERTVEGDLYQFRAWRHEPRRALQRLIIAPDDGLAALFVQIPLGEPHDEAVAAAMDAAAVALPEGMPRVSMSRAIRTLDQVDLDGASGELDEDQGRFQARNTRFRARGATIAFSADPEIASYTMVEPVRQVRRALHPEDFSGESAKLVINLTSGTGMRRQVMMSIDGRQDRIYLFAQMTRKEVLAVVAKILEVLP